MLAIIFIWWYNNIAQQINILAEMRFFTFLGRGYYTLFLRTHLEFDKNANSNYVCVLLVLHKICCATIGVCVFYALTAVDAFFYFKNLYLEVVRKTMKRKLLTTMLALMMTASVATAMVSCDNGDSSHTHTFATEWTTDATHHWYSATCEHTTEVSAKAEHSWGTDGKCSVCQKEKPVDTAVTQEEWISSIEGIATTTNVRAVAESTGPELPLQTSSIEIDGDKMCWILMEPSTSSYKEEITVKTGDNAYAIYQRTSQTGEYAMSNSSNIGSPAYVWDSFIQIAQVAKDKFANATFDETTKTYSLVLGETTVSGLGTLYGIEYSFAFEEGTLKSMNVICTETADDVRMDIEFAFGEVSIAIPEA